MRISYMKYRAGRISLLLAGCCLLATACARGAITDPWEGFNRDIYRFNKVFDGVLVKPVATTYNHYTPAFAKTGVRNFFNNLDEINVVVNDVLQGKLGDAMHDSGRFLINSTAGVGGVLDVAAHFGMIKHYEDFGQTLGVWGFGQGGYMVLPVFGSSSVRDTIALVPNKLLSPLTWVRDSKVRGGLIFMEMVDIRVSYLAAETMIRGDEYSFVRDAYIQRRAYLIADGEIYDEFDEY